MGTDPPGVFAGGTRNIFVTVAQTLSVCIPIDVVAGISLKQHPKGAEGF